LLKRENNPVPVLIELSPFLRKYVPNYDPAEGLVLENASGKRVAQLIEELGIPDQEVTSIMVNRFPSKPSHLVKDGDVIGLLMILGGG